jgi:hypothetical protein
VFGKRMSLTEGLLALQSVFTHKKGTSTFNFEFNFELN